MQLKEFVSSSLSDILHGVSEAIENTKDTSGAINPFRGDIGSNLEGLAQLVQFDVAVTVANDVTKGVEGGLKVAWVNIGGEISKEVENSSISRIQFSIPIVPPVQSVKDE